jgi:hypothetical protein
MRVIGRRLKKLEKIFAPVVVCEDTWGSMAELRNDLLRQAEQRGEPPVAALKEELEQLGPLGLWREAARGYLSDHGFIQSGNESLAQTMARALGIDTDELRVWIAESRIGTALLERFREPEKHYRYCDLTYRAGKIVIRGSLPQLNLGYCCCVAGPRPCPPPRFGGSQPSNDGPF